MLNGGHHSDMRNKEKTMQAKQIIIAVAGTGGKREFKDVAILPGTRAKDVLTKLGLTGFQLMKPEGGAFANTDDLYASLADGQKVYAAKADVEAGCRELVGA
jgi:hypothetical protein